LEAGSERLGVFICYESVFPDEVRQFGQQRRSGLCKIFRMMAGMETAGRYAQHLNQTRMRAIENDPAAFLSATDTG